MNKVKALLISAVVLAGCMPTESYVLKLPNESESTPSTENNVGVAQHEYQALPENEGLRAIVPNPRVPAVQAIAICEPQADQAKMQAENSTPQNDYGSTEWCSDYGLYERCTSHSSSGGFAGGFADGFSSGMNAKRAYKSALSSCLAQFGWRQ